MKTYICLSCKEKRNVSNNYTQDKIDCGNCGKLAVSEEKYAEKVALKLRGKDEASNNILPSFFK